MKNIIKIKIQHVLLFFILFCAKIAWCGNINPYNDNSKYSYGENVGWFNYDTRDGNVNVCDLNLSGYVWAENIGWINLSPPFGGITNDGTGLLSGYAWGENVGWLNFNPQVSGDPNHYGIMIDVEGKFDGWAYGENIGWIHLRATLPVTYGVQTSWTTSLYVDVDDLEHFSQQWLDEGPGISADLDNDNDVDFQDLAVLAEKWLEKCPSGWPLAY